MVSSDIAGGVQIASVACFRVVYRGTSLESLQRMIARFESLMRFARRKMQGDNGADGGEKTARPFSGKVESERGQRARRRENRAGWIDECVKVR